LRDAQERGKDKQKITLSEELDGGRINVQLYGFTLSRLNDTSPFVLRICRGLPQIFRLRHHHVNALMTASIKSCSHLTRSSMSLVSVVGSDFFVDVWKPWSTRIATIYSPLAQLHAKFLSPYGRYGGHSTADAEDNINPSRSVLNIRIQGAETIYKFVRNVQICRTDLWWKCV
jgi:hypothetical protein